MRQNVQYILSNQIESNVNTQKANNWVFAIDNVISSNRSKNICRFLWYILFFIIDRFFGALHSLCSITEWMAKAKGKYNGTTAEIHQICDFFHSIMFINKLWLHFHIVSRVHIEYAYANILYFFDACAHTLQICFVVFVHFIVFSCTMTLAHANGANTNRTAAISHKIILCATLCISFAFQIQSKRLLGKTRACTCQSHHHHLFFYSQMISENSVCDWIIYNMIFTFCCENKLMLLLLTLTEWYGGVSERYRCTEIVSKV